MRVGRHMHEDGAAPPKSFRYGEAAGDGVSGDLLEASSLTIASKPLEVTRNMAPGAPLAAERAVQCHFDILQSGGLFFYMTRSVVDGDREAYPRAVLSPCDASAPPLPKTLLGEQATDMTAPTSASGHAPSSATPTSTGQTLARSSLPAATACTSSAPASATPTRSPRCEVTPDSRQGFSLRMEGGGCGGR